MPFALFVVITAILFLRPSEIVPAVSGWPLYEAAVLCCLAISVDPVLNQLSPARLRENPITVCILGVLFAVVASSAVHRGVAVAATAGFEVFKIVLYHVTLLAVIDSPRRLRQFLVCILGLTVAVAALPLLQEAGVLRLDLVPTVKEFGYDPQNGVHEILRLKSVGLDPNDLAMILAPMMLLALWRLTDRDAGMAKLFWLAPLTLFAHVFLRTQSRGGMICLLAGLAAFSTTRFGFRRTLVGAVIVLPLILASEGRFTDPSAMESGTGQSRIRLWSGGLAMFRADPVFGAGYGAFVERMGEVAHNSYMDCFAELGFIGGSCFAGAFLCAIWMLWRATPPPVVALQSVAEIAEQRELMRLRPYLIGAAVAYAVGMLSLSRVYVVPTYMILGLSTVWLRAASPAIQSPPPRFDFRFARGLATIGVVFLSSTHAFVQVFLRW